MRKAGGGWGRGEKGKEGVREGGRYVGREGGREGRREGGREGKEEEVHGTQGWEKERERVQIETLSPALPTHYTSRQPQTAAPQPTEYRVHTGVGIN